MSHLDFMFNEMETRMKLHWILSIAAAVAFIYSPTVHAESNSIRIATYNVSLYGKKAGQIRERLSDGEDQQATDIAKIVQTVRPDILLLNELDHDADSATAKLLAKKFFAKDHGSLQGIDYPYVYSAASNTGVDSKLDLNNNDQLGEPTDCWGFGVYPGQYSMAVFSTYPLDVEKIRTFQKFLWKDLPGALRPVDPQSKQSYYDDAIWGRFRLSSKNHIDVPVIVSKDYVVHILASHPTPPVFDGPEDRNGCRNHDEIAFWNHYLSDGAEKLSDDQGRVGGLAPQERFVIMGDLNSDPVDGDSQRDAINDLIGHKRVHDPLPKSTGAAGDAKGKAAARQKGDPSTDTANFGGNLRVDFVLPSQTMSVRRSGVFWPKSDALNRKLIEASDHRMVWIEVELP